jgi:hypothetical protein
MTAGVATRRVLPDRLRYSAVRDVVLIAMHAADGVLFLASDWAAYVTRQFWGAKGNDPLP